MDNEFENEPGKSEENQERPVWQRESNVDHSHEQANSAQNMNERPAWQRTTAGSQFTGNYNQTQNGTQGGAQNGTTYQNGQGQSTYRYTGSQLNQQYARWQPNAEKYNTPPQPVKKEKKKKGASKGWIISTIVLAVVVALVVVCCTIGFGLLGNKIEKLQSSSGSSQVETAISRENYTDSDDGTEYYSMTDVSNVVDDIMPAVVSITSRTMVSSGNYWGFWGNSNSSSQEVESGLGSGTIIAENDTELMILTSYHVVEDCSSLYVTFCDGESVDGYVKAADETCDIAVVGLNLSDIKDSTLKEIKIAQLSQDKVTVGEGVIVIGNALGYGQSVTTGVVSAVDRSITKDNNQINVIQTDAAINSGNSGGCMLNEYGEVVGISEAKIVVSNVEGMCYAISVNEYYDVIQDLINAETPENATGDSVDSGSNSNSQGSISQGGSSSSQSAYLGIYGQDISSDVASSQNMEEGVYIVGVVSGSGAEQAGLQAGDIITKIDGSDATTLSALQSALAKHSAGDVVEITYMREGTSGYTESTVKVTLTSSQS